MNASLSLTEQDSKRVTDALIEEIQQTGRVLRREIDTLGTVAGNAFKPNEWGTVAYRLMTKVDNLFDKLALKGLTICK